MTFSIILPTYNRAQLISKSIRSIIDQTYRTWELIVVDDGSIDNTKEIVESFLDDRIKYIYQENAERSVARNNGIKHAKGEWICFLDSDDYFLPNHLNVFANFIKKGAPMPSLLVSGCYHEKNGVLVKNPIFKEDSGQHPAEFILEKTTITPISVCVHRSCFNNHKFLEDFKKSYWEDTHLWIRLAIEFPFYQLNEYTNVLAEHSGRSVNSNVNIIRVNDHIRMIKHLFKKYQIILNPILTENDKFLYLDRKYRIFLYQARQNKQIGIAMNIWVKGIIHKPSYYLLTEFPKIFLNKMNIGIHE